MSELSRRHSRRSDATSRCSPTDRRILTSADSPADQRVLPLRSLLRSRTGLDLLHVFGLFLPRHAAVLARHAAGPTPVVLSPLSHLQPPALAGHRARKHSFMAVLTPVLRRLDAVHVFSETERHSLKPWSALRGSPSFIASLGTYDADVIAATDPRVARDDRLLRPQRRSPKGHRPRNPGVLSLRQRKWGRRSARVS